ncbi:MAG: septal ring lytic transglycosylase RlpA family protein [Candidatus Omnitrophota bacterium]|nr:septal ring lytic transglycosylase RlpA family protein [Candidatus Omnitrophota bacterium]
MKRSLAGKITKISYFLILITVFSVISSQISSDASFIYLKGIASWYSEFSPGIRPTTANMEIFDHDKMTCAMWGVPFDTVVDVTNLRNGKTVTVRVNDRGPARRLCRQGRVVDLTMGAFKRIEDPEKGLAMVKLRILK